MVSGPHAHAHTSSHPSPPRVKPRRHRKSRTSSHATIDDAAGLTAAVSSRTASRSRWLRKSPRHASRSIAGYVQEFLRPTLTPGAIVIRDNLSVHNRADIRALVDAAGCQLVFLPPYSPDFNPLELVLSKRKTRLRRLAARTQEAVEAAIAEALTTVTVQDARKCFRHCGYPASDQ